MIRSDGILEMKFQVDIRLSDTKGVEGLFLRRYLYIVEKLTECIVSLVTELTAFGVARNLFLF